MAVLLHPPCCPATCRLPLHSPPARPPTCIRCIPMLQRRDSGWVTQRRRHRPRAALATRGAPQAELGHRFSVLHQACRRLHWVGQEEGGAESCTVQGLHRYGQVLGNISQQAPFQRPSPPSQAAPRSIAAAAAQPCPACPCPHLQPINLRLLPGCVGLQRSGTQRLQRQPPALAILAVNGIRKRLGLRDCGSGWEAGGHM